MKWIVSLPWPRRLLGIRPTDSVLSFIPASSHPTSPRRPKGDHCIAQTQIHVDGKTKMNTSNDVRIDGELPLDPESWGWRGDIFAAWQDAQSRCSGSYPVPARILSREHHLYEALCPDFSGRPGMESVPPGGGTLKGLRVSGRFELHARGAADFPSAGDWVLLDSRGESARIQGILPRRTVLSRGMAGPTAEEQVLAANVDTLILAFALDGGRNFLARFLERALVTARNSGASAVIVLNKIDLASEETREEALQEAHRLASSVPVFAVSARTGEGIREMAQCLSPGETAGLLGKSGVGKSALVNALGEGGSAPAREGANRDNDRRGRHTTTSSTLYRLPSGVLMLDGPGIRELKLWGDAEGLEGAFGDIEEIAGRCRFADCSHGAEPGCALREALEAGAVDPARYRSWLNLRREMAWAERRSDERARREDAEKWKRISKLQKELRRERR